MTTNTPDPNMKGVNRTLWVTLAAIAAVIAIVVAIVTVQQHAQEQQQTRDYCIAVGIDNGADYATAREQCNEEN